MKIKYKNVISLTMVVSIMIMSVMVTAVFSMPAASLGAVYGSSGAASGGSSGTSFVPAPQTAYAQAFVDACEGQQWLLDYTEKLLNARQKSINTLTASSDLDFITTLGFADRNLTGKIPAAIGEYRQLKYLFLSGNQLSGDIPAALFTLNHLVNIDLGGNAFSGAVPDAFGTMTSLEVLNLEDNSFTGTIPDAVLSNTHIRFLGLGGNRLTGGIPARVSAMTSLEYLDLSENNLQGTIPSLSTLTNLKVLSLWNCGLDGEVPADLFSVSGLQILDLAGNRLTGDPLTAFAGLSSLTSLKVFTADGNGFRGTLPDSFPSSLEIVHLENNDIRGYVPASLAAVETAGGEVFLAGNYMTGTVLKNMKGNGLNFTDGAAGQYRLAFTRTEQLITSEAAVNFFPLLENRPVTGSLAAKPMLGTGEYTYTYDSSKIELTVTETEVLVKALCEIKKTDNTTVSMQILGNDGSEYSAASITVHTEKPLPGGSFTGGSDHTPEPAFHKPFISGFSDGSFRPDAGVTREQTASMLAKAMDADLSAQESGGSPDAAKLRAFTDVEDGRWSAAAVSAAAAQGWFTGYRDGSFQPSKTITRAELATVLVKIAEAQGLVPSATQTAFSDVEETAWYSRYVEKAAAFGLVTGYSDGTFRPEKDVTRAEAVVMICKLLGRDCGADVILKNASAAGNAAAAETPFADAASHWAYRYILEASAGHEAQQ